MYFPRTVISVIECGPISMLYIILLLLYCVNKYFYFTAEMQERSYSIILYIIICNFMNNICVMNSLFQVRSSLFKAFCNAMVLQLYRTTCPCLHKTNTVLLSFGSSLLSKQYCFLLSNNCYLILGFINFSYKFISPQTGNARRVEFTGTYFFL